MERKYRLTDREDFQRVRRSGRSWAHPLMVLTAMPNELGRTRVGFAVGKRIGKAVVRNRVRRRMREAVRLRISQIAPGWDLVFIGREPIRETTFAQITAAVEQLLRRARLLKPREMVEIHQ